MSRLRVIPRRRRSSQSRAVVTGAGSGIGRAFAWELARRDGQVVCADIKGARAEQTAEAICSELGAKAIAVVCDVASLDDVVVLADTAAEWLSGPVDFVVNNAGVGVGGHPVGEIPISDWQWTMDVNLWGGHPRLSRFRSPAPGCGTGQHHQRRFGGQLRCGAKYGPVQRHQGRRARPH